MVTANIPLFLTARTINGDKVINTAKEHLGKIEDLMIDLENGRVAYAVLSFGGFLGLGNKLFAVPWEALTVRPHEHSFVLNVSKETLEKAEGFDKDDWPLTREWLANYLYLLRIQALLADRSFRADKKREARRDRSKKNILNRKEGRIKIRNRRS